MMHFAIDIDQTICGENADLVYMAFYNNYLGLGINDATMDGLANYHEFVTLPQVRNYYKNHQREWHAARSQAIETPEVLAALSPLAGAVESVTTLASHGSIGYYTARSKSTQDVTQVWLEHAGFPCSQCVVCCESIEGKLLLLASHEPQQEQIILIDDRGSTYVLRALENIKKQISIKAFLRKLTIIAFNVNRVPATRLCQVIALPSWRDIQGVLETLKQEAII